MPPVRLMLLSTDSDDVVEVILDILPSLPTHGFEGAELALWKCYALTGEDISDGPSGDWHMAAMLAVMEMRDERDEFASALDHLIEKAEAIRAELKEIL